MSIPEHAVFVYSTHNFLSRVRDLKNYDVYFQLCNIRDIQGKFLKERMLKASKVFVNSILLYLWKPRLAPDPANYFRGLFTLVLDAAKTSTKLNHI